MVIINTLVLVIVLVVVLAIVVILGYYNTELLTPIPVPSIELSHSPSEPLGTISPLTFAHEQNYTLFKSDTSSNTDPIYLNPIIQASYAIPDTAKIKIKSDKPTNITSNYYNTKINIKNDNTPYNFPLLVEKSNSDALLYGGPTSKQMGYLAFDKNTGTVSISNREGKLNQKKNGDVFNILKNKNDTYILDKSHNKYLAPHLIGKTFYFILTNVPYNWHF